VDNDLIGTVNGKICHSMFVKAYRYFKSKLDTLKLNYAAGTVSKGMYVLKILFLRIVIQLIVLPHFLLLGPFKTFVTFARKDETGSWIDSYNDFVISNRISIRGIVALILIGVVAVLVFIYLPILYI
jgi:hypothetical protein